MNIEFSDLNLKRIMLILLLYDFIIIWFLYLRDFYIVPTMLSIKYIRNS